MPRPGRSRRADPGGWWSSASAPAGASPSAGTSLVRVGAVTDGEPVVDTNGAGDALAVGVLDALVLDGLDLGTALDRGQQLARQVCARRPRGGAAKAMPGLG
jgi:sugar/nucleoside kinase (ribokinase family)